MVPLNVDFPALNTHQKGGVRNLLGSMNSAPRLVTGRPLVAGDDKNAHVTCRSPWSLLHFAWMLGLQLFANEWVFRIKPLEVESF